MRQFTVFGKTSFSTLTDGGSELFIAETYTKYSRDIIGPSHQSSRQLLIHSIQKYNVKITTPAFKHKLTQQAKI